MACKTKGAHDHERECLPAIANARDATHVSMQNEKKEKNGDFHRGGGGRCHRPGFLTSLNTAR